jgi:hypothetical protein
MSISISRFYQEGKMKWLLWPLVILVLVVGAALLIATGRFDIKSPDFSAMSALAVLFTCLAVEPFIRFLDFGWFVRYDEFKNGMNHDAVRAYLGKFWARRSNDYIKLLPPSQKQLNVLEDLDDNQTMQIFDQVYKDQYGIGAFVAPLVLLVIIVFMESLLVTYLKYNPTEDIYGVDKSVIVSAVAGAYLFSVGDAVLSVRKRSLNVSDIYWYDLRLALAIPLGIAFAANSTASGTSHAGVAFAIGALPVDVLIKTIRRLALSALAPGEKRQVEPDQLITLQGVTVATSGLLSAEGVTSIEQITGMDPILVAIRTGLPFSLILFLGSQAVVRRRFCENAQKLGQFGLVDAESISSLASRVERVRRDKFDDTDAESILRAVSESLRRKDGESAEDRVAATLYQFQLIRSDPYTRFLVQVKGENP